MKKVYIISLIAIITIAALQGFNIFLQYSNYTLEEMDKVNTSIYGSIDEELNLRSRKSIQPDKIGEQHFVYKQYAPTEKIPNKNPKDTIIDLQTIDAKDLKKKGFIRSSSDIINLLMQDNNLEKGKDINLSILDTLISKNLKVKYKYTIYLLDKNKNVIKKVGDQNDKDSWYKSEDIAINLTNPRFIRVAVHITPSKFIFQSIWTLVLSLLFVLIAAICIYYQLREIRSMDRLLKSRELTVNSIIHDLKSPINSIIILMGVIKQKMTDATTLTLAGQITNKAKQLVCDIETILSTASDKRRIILNLENVNAVELANNAKQDVDIIYKDKPHTITIHNDTQGNGTVKADKMYLLNVIRNLVENAIKYADNGVLVNVSIKRNDRALQISVADNGWGISKKDQKQIFKQFYRVAHKHSPRGHGIGLALVKYVVESHGGQIIVNSEIGKGSKFVFYIPFQ